MIESNKDTSNDHFSTRSLCHSMEFDIFNMYLAIVCPHSNDCGCNRFDILPEEDGDASLGVLCLYRLHALVDIYNK